MGLMTQTPAAEGCCGHCRFREHGDGLLLLVHVFGVGSSVAKQEPA